MVQGEPGCVWAAGAGELVSWEVVRPDWGEPRSFKDSLSLAPGCLLEALGIQPAAEPEPRQAEVWVPLAQRQHLAPTCGLHCCCGQWGDLSFGVHCCLSCVVYRQAHQRQQGLPEHSDQPQPVAQQHPGLPPGQQQQREQRELCPGREGGRAGPLLHTLQGRAPQEGAADGREAAHAGHREALRGDCWAG